MSGDNGVVIQTACVLQNHPLCREHFRLTLRLEEWPGAAPGQFVHLCPSTQLGKAYQSFERCVPHPRNEWVAQWRLPMLRRAFSIAGCRRSNDGVDIDVLYRAVGTATRWMATLVPDDLINVLGPLGNTFPASSLKPGAWLVSGGVGLPPMLWLAEALAGLDRKVVAFCGAQTADLLPLTIDPTKPPAADAHAATPTAAEFSVHGVPVVLSTDDGSLGFRGYIGQAMAAYDSANPPAREEPVVVYTCGPEPMMRFVAEFCLSRQIECYVCMERSMACGVGTCQSCVVPVRDEADHDGWRYRLCCTEGPIFDAGKIIWEPAGVT